MVSNRSRTKIVRHEVLGYVTHAKTDERYNYGTVLYVTNECLFSPVSYVCRPF